MAHVLGTSTLSFLMRGDPEVVRSLTSRPRTEVFLVAPVVAEIEYGLARTAPSKRRQRLRERFDVIKAELPRVDWSDDVSVAFGEIKSELERRGVRLEDMDVAVAAHARARGAMVVTGDLEHMRRIAGLQIEDWRPARA